MTPDADAVAEALEVVGQRWALLIVRSLLESPKRYGDLQRELGVPTNILATRLKGLQAAGILFRVPLAHNVLAYDLTERGTALRETIDALARWGAQSQRSRDGLPAPAERLRPSASRAPERPA